MLRVALAVGLGLALVAGPGVSALADEEVRRGAVTPVGDLNGDGVDDLVWLEFDALHDGPVVALAPAIEVVAASGRGGAELWRRDVTTFVRPVPIDLAGGQAGVLLVEGPAIDEVSGAFTFAALGVAAGAAMVDDSRLHLEAVRGDGTLAWERTFADGVAAGAGGHVAGEDGGLVAAGDYAAYVGLLVAGGSSDGVALTVVDRFNAPTGYEAGTVGLVLDVATGEERWRAEHSASDAAPRLRLAGDVSGDGSDDVVFIDTEDGGGGVIAYRGVDGSQLWANPEVVVDEFPWVSPLGDLSGDGHGEVAVSSVEDLNDPDVTNVVLDGATGAKRFTTRTPTLIPVGDVTGDGRTEVVAVDRGDAGIEHRVMDADGVTRVGPSIIAAGEAGTWQMDAEAGDLDADGVTDVAHRFVVSGQDSARTFFVSGATLTPIRVSDDRELPLRAAVVGVVHDTIAVAPDGDAAMLLEARDGSSGASHWATSVPLPAGSDRFVDATVHVSDLSGDGQPDVLVDLRSSQVVCTVLGVPGVGCLGGQTTRSDRVLVALSGTTGEVLWQR